MIFKAMKLQALLIFLSIILIICHAHSLRGLQDFEWIVELADGYPTIDFSSQSTDGELIMKYVYEGTLSENKFLSYEVLQYDCFARGDGSVLSTEPDLETPGELNFKADIIQANITDSVHYKDVNPTTAIVSFCLRVDYNMKNLLGNIESVNFHETKFTATIDRTAGFSITDIVAERVAADETACEAELDYPVDAYFCDVFGNEVQPSPLSQGSFMEVCIRMDPSVVSEVYVEDVVSFIVSQPAGPGSPSIAILNSQTDLLTSKTCGLNGGICHVKTQLKSQYFASADPNDLAVDGTAIISFGSPRRLQQNEDIENGCKKVDICHFANQQTLNICEEAVPAHLEHGDTLGACEITAESPEGSTNACKKVDICHFANQQTLNICEEAVPAHLAHGDTLGACQITPATAATAASGGSSPQRTGNPGAYTQGNCRRRKLLLNFKQKLNDAAGFDTDVYNRHRHLQTSDSDTQTPFNLTVPVLRYEEMAVQEESSSGVPMAGLVALLIVSAGIIFAVSSRRKHVKQASIDYQPKLVLGRDHRPHMYRSEAYTWDDR